MKMIAPYPAMVLSADAEMTFSIDCPTCGACADELCLTESGWGPDGFAHPERDAAIIVEFDESPNGAGPLLLRAVILDAERPKGCSPNVDSVTIDLLAEEIAPEFADLIPSEDGLFHLGKLDWSCFRLIREAQ